ncbi:hypothetical protein G4177_25745 [Corallococcus sp. ZKHCc1 1396]|uniref:Uncharacterized protein n=1 Tax=Corallococcus soli TaxID=2710757 RepID=A0ABR9PUY0_9BACT|nr:hypothetical protein [Corallococcus soli]MBE4751582.1 hypothetical protein [Corallococcus soli]
MRFTASSAALLFAASLATACGGPLEQEDLASTSDELVIGPIGPGPIIPSPVLQCIGSDTVLAQPDGAMAYAYWSCSAPTQFHGTSNDATYTQPGCKDRFVTEVASLGGNVAFPFVEAIPSSAITTQAACNALFVTAAAWGKFNGVWSGLGTASGSGVWTPPYGSRPGSCNARIYFPAEDGYDAIRVGGLATSYSTTRIRVRTGVSVLGKIC